jgi:hypothetical protein
MSMTINPIDNGTNVITAANGAAGVVFGGIDTEPSGQNTSLTLSAAYENVHDAVFTFLNANGAWAVTLLDTPAINNLPDGVYSANVSNFNRADYSPNETVILATQHTAFEVVGMAFLDVSTALTTTAPLKASVFADMTAEAAGLQTLLHYDALPAKPMNTLISEVSKELSILDFSPQIGGNADRSVVARLDHEQRTMAAFVQHTPALVALMPDHVGW